MAEPWTVTLNDEATVSLFLPVGITDNGVRKHGAARVAGQAAMARTTVG